MPSNPSTAFTLQYTTDYPMEKVIMLKSGSFPLAGSTFDYTYSIPHGLPFIPLVGGGWSLTNSFVTQYNYASGVPSSNPNIQFDTEVNIYADATNIYFFCQNYSVARTIYFRVFGLQPINDTTKLEPTVSQGDRFNFNTDYNLLNVLVSNIINVPDATSSAQTVTASYASTGQLTLGLGWLTASTYNGLTTVQAIHPVGTRHPAANGTNMYSDSNDSMSFETNVGYAATTVHYRLYA